MLYVYFINMLVSIVVNYYWIKLCGISKFFNENVYLDKILIKYYYVNNKYVWSEKLGIGFYFNLWNE